MALRLPCRVTPLTSRVALRVALLKAVVSPLLVVFAVLPLLPLVVSQARNVRPLITLPTVAASGT